MDVYADVAKEVEPKKARLAEMSALLDAANATLSEKQTQLKVGCCIIILVIFILNTHFPPLSYCYAIV